MPSVSQQQRAANLVRLHACEQRVAQLCEIGEADETVEGGYADCAVIILFGMQGHGRVPRRAIIASAPPIIPSMSDALPVLYSFRRCPYAIRARLALHYAGIACELREVVLRDKPAEMLELSPKGTVPVLWLPHGDVIDESLDVMLWALAQHDPDGWLAADRRAADALITGNDDEFKVWLDRYKYPDRYKDIDSERAGEACWVFLDRLEARLEQQPCLLGSEPGLADYALFPFVRQFAFVDIDAFRAAGRRRLVTWLDGLLESSLFAAVMAKYPPWSAGDPVTVF